MRTRVAERLRQVLTALAAEGVVPRVPQDIPLERPKRPEHGDFATNIALALAKIAGKPPRELAQRIADALPDGRSVASAEVAGPGFINVRVAPEAFGRAVCDVLAGAPGALRPTPRDKQKVLVEFVSANPTGPLHVGHGRGSIVGDALVRVLRAAGHDAGAEYYWNDRGNQVRLLGESVGYRYREALGLDAAPPTDENWYRGEYIKEIAQALVAEVGRAHADRPISDPAFLAFGEARLKAWIKADLEALGVTFDTWISERGLVEDGTVERILAELRTKSAPDGSPLVSADPDGAVFLRTKHLGDEKDRVLVKSSGDLTYFGTDVPYHVHKLERGWTTLIDVWGADHHGHVQRMKLALQALGRDATAFEVVLVQMVSVTRGGEAVVQSKRAGNFVELRDVLEEAGRDACRFFFLMRRHDSQLEFDLELAKRKSLDNPVFYIQYGHARLCSILRRAAELGIEVPAAEPARLAALGAEEREIVGLLAGYPDVLAEAARAREPHRVVFYLQELAQAFASYFTRLQKVHRDTILPQASQRVEDWRATWNFERTGARLLWVAAIRKVFADALGILGVSAPEKMDRLPEEEGAREEEPPRA